MKIDFNKLIVLLLPTFLRQTVLAYFIEACIKPAKVLYNDLVSWAEEKRLELATNYQICYLEAYLNYKLLGSFDRKIVIVNSDGITTDFSVVVPTTVTVDTYRLKAIVDKYKLIGKRYEVVGGTVSYQYEWQSFYPEILSVDDAAKWGDFYPEIESVKKDAFICIEITSNQPHIYASAYAIDSNGDSVKVTSDVVIQLNVQWRLESNWNEKNSATIELTISAGNSLSPTSTINNVNDFQELSGSSVNSITPATDDNYIYNYGQLNED
jgi:hypothetical protein